MHPSRHQRTRISRPPKRHSCAGVGQSLEKFKRVMFVQFIRIRTLLLVGLLNITIIHYHILPPIVDKQKLSLYTSSTWE